jgi:hypothetical protein
VFSSLSRFPHEQFLVNNTRMVTWRIVLQVWKNGAIKLFIVMTIVRIKTNLISKSLLQLSPPERPLLPIHSLMVYDSYIT